MKPIDLTIIAGFFGCGKTTFLHNVLQSANTQKIGVLVNEFGSVGMDGKKLQRDGIPLVELNGGSIFCACLKDGFIKTLLAMAALPIDVLWIENSGLADPCEMPALLEKIDGLLPRKYTYKGSICLIDSTSFLDMSDLLPVLEGQVSSASLILLNKADLVTPQELQEVHEKVKTLNSKASVHTTTYGIMPLEWMEKVHTITAEPRESSNTPSSRPESYLLRAQGEYTAESLRLFAQELGPYTHRIKGFAPSREGWLNIEYSGKLAEVAPFHHEPGVEQLTLVVITKKSGVDDSIKNTWNRFFTQEIMVEVQ